jgi:hypothetical protein
MKREEIVRRIVAILGSDSQKDVEATLNDMEKYEWERAEISLFQNKEQRKKLEKFVTSMRRLRADLNNLPNRLRTVILSTEFDKECNYWINYCEDYLAQPRHKPRPDAWRQRLATRLAHQLLTSHKELHNEPASRGRKGDWCRIAALLYGDKDINMQPYLREFSLSWIELPRDERP